MKLCLINHNFKYELEKLARIFMPFEKIEVLNEAADDEFCALSILDEEKHLAKAEIFSNGRKIAKALPINIEASVYDKECELKLAQALYLAFSEITGWNSDWGILTGIRPTKLYNKILAEQKTKENTAKYFSDVFYVSSKKLSLCEETSKSEDSIIELSKPNSVSLYISIPFCPSRCSYCSFVSHSVEAAAKLIPQYVDLLCEEIKVTSELIKRNKLHLETVYIGGGTPTAISALELEKIMKTVSLCFDVKSLREYTVEAGRPDTVTKEKLLVIKNGGATRISINPQTMNDEVLKEIGRRHTSAQTKEAYYLARECGFDNINMDLIAGLPTDTYDSFKATIYEILNLDPESVTIHTLSLKRSSTLTKNSAFPDVEQGKEVSLMVDFAREKLTQNGILPYYMYRQSKTVGNLENIGYSKQGFEGLYNVYIMDETHSILACGASAVTKLREPGGDYIERIFNYKYPYEYISNFDEMLRRKKGVNEFYDKFSW